MVVSTIHFSSGLSAPMKINYSKMLERIDRSIEAILLFELSAGNKILEVRSDVESDDDLTILLQQAYHQDYENDQLTKLISTDAHDHGVFYIRNKEPRQKIIAPYYYSSEAKSI